MQNFDAFGLHPHLLGALNKHNFFIPTPIQAEAIPVALEGKDIIGSAHTGTGKTAAFGIPLISHLLKNRQDCALVMTPTRELAAQVRDMLQKMLGADSGIHTTLIVGGEPISKQLHQLRTRNSRIIIGTPGRINDHLERRSIKFDKTRFLVLDEADRMLDMGFSIQIDRILCHVPQERQTLLFSATLPGNIIKLSKKYLIDPVHISIQSTSIAATSIKQETIHVAESDKYNHLLTHLNQCEGSIIVFVKTKMGADKMAHKLRLLNHEASAIHGDLRQNQRDRVIKAFRNRKNRIMVATDVAARGLDIDHVKHVINYDVPHSAEDYFHRIGRTGRAGADGSAWNFVTPQDGKRWKAISRLLNPNEKHDKPSSGDKKPHKRAKNRRSGARRFSRR